MTALGRSTVRHIVKIPNRSDVIELSWHGVTHTGHRRPANEDSYLADVPLFVVADGMGGHAHGDRASDSVVRRLQAAVVDDYIDSEAIAEALRLATSDIHELDDRDHGIGTTVTGVALSLHDDQPVLTIFNVGDSRVYGYIAGVLGQLTTDHSMVQELVDSGQLAASEAEEHPEANVITRAVGFSTAPDIDFTRVPLESGMRLLLCSDGLTKELSHGAISAHLAAGLSARETAEALVEAALEAGGRDNVTVVLIDIERAPAHDE
jgi:PPM family protein phosphatase